MNTSNTAAVRAGEQMVRTLLEGANDQIVEVIDDKRPIAITCQIKLMGDDWKKVRQFMQHDKEWRGVSLDVAVSLLAQQAANGWRAV